MWALRRAALSLEFACFGFLLGFTPGQETEARRNGGEGQTIRVDVEMVSLDVVVSTRDGKRVTDLRKEDFLIFEDGVAQPISAFANTEEPISVVLALDTSGSTERKLDSIKNDAIRFVNILRPEDSVAIMSFGLTVKLLEKHTVDRNKIALGIMKTQSGGDTPLYEAVLSSLEDVLKPVKRRKALILFTDGVDTASREIGEMATLNAAREDNATIYSIYFNTFRNVPYQPAQAPQPSPGGRPSSGIPAPGMPPETVTMPPISGTVVPRGASVVDHVLGRDYLRRLSDSSGGMVVDALKLQDVGPAFEQIAKELASQYSIGYYPTNTAHDGKFRKVQVKLNEPGLAVRTRKGYTAPKPPDGKKKK